MNPSGRQHEIRFGDQVAVVVEVGGGLRSYDAGGRPVLDGYDASEMVTGARGQQLIPWPNRLHGGSYRWDGVEHPVPMDEPDQQNALHGLVRWRSWTAAEQSTSSVTMVLQLLPQPAYPFALELAVRYEVGEDGLTVTTTATNAGAAVAPYGCGAHPYLTVGTERVDDVELLVPASTWLPTGPAQIPLGRESVDGTPYDFRRGRAIESLHVDNTFTDLERGSDGRAVAVLAGPDRTVEMWVDEHYPYLEVFTGDTLPEPERRRRSLGLEPMTCPPNAFVTGEDLVRLAPGEPLTTQWGVRVR